MQKDNDSWLISFDMNIHFVRYECSYRTIRALMPNGVSQL